LGIAPATVTPETEACSRLRSSTVKRSKSFASRGLAQQDVTTAKALQDAPASPKPRSLPRDCCRRVRAGSPLALPQAQGGVGDCGGHSSRAHDAREPAQARGICYGEGAGRQKADKRVLDGYLRRAPTACRSRHGKMVSSSGRVAGNDVHLIDAVSGPRHNIGLHFERGPGASPLPGRYAPSAPRSRWRPAPSCVLWAPRKIATSVESKHLRSCGRCQPLAVAPSPFPRIRPCASETREEQRRFSCFASWTDAPASSRRHGEKRYHVAPCRARVSCSARPPRWSASGPDQRTVKCTSRRGTPSSSCTFATSDPARDAALLRHRAPHRRNAYAAEPPAGAQAQVQLNVARFPARQGNHPTVRSRDAKRDHPGRSTPATARLATRPV
jgi:hypothetical protein